VIVFPDSYHGCVVARFTLAVAMSIIVAAFVRAGLYDPQKPEVELMGPKGLEALPHQVFWDRLSDLRVIAVPNRPNNKKRDEALAARDKLVKKGSLTPAERIQLGILRLHLGEFDAALMDLQQAYAANPRDFFVMTVLGTVYQQTGQLTEAARYLEAARDLFADKWPANPEQVAAIRSLEAAQLKLARLRLREQAISRTGRPPPPENVDDLFGIRFIGPSGDYEPGNLADEQKSKLPVDATSTVQQLLLWLPNDSRLYWLLGELYAASGEFESALEVFSECLDTRRFDAPLLRQHRQAIKEAIAGRNAAAESAWIPNASRWWLAALFIGPIFLVLIYFQFRQFFRRQSRT